MINSLVGARIEPDIFFTYNPFNAQVPRNRICY